MIYNRAPFYHHVGLDGPQFFERYGIRALLIWLSSRAFRGGPRLLFQLVACLFVIYLLWQPLPKRASEVAFGRHYDQLWRWAATPVGTAKEGETDQGGLRVVVFGASDIATPVGEKEKRDGDRTWMETMCEELGCSSYVSLIPEPKGYSLSSNAAYAKALDKLANATSLYADQKNASEAPGRDYSFLPELYPVPTAPDFGAQVADFLSRPPPEDLPKETVWVLNFGQWDVWNLAALPESLGKKVVEDMVTDMFVHLEKLYLASMDEKSIAHSDYYQSSTTKLDLVRKPNPPMSPAGLGAQAVRTEESETFRIIVPMIFDPTLIPGWQTERPELPAAHSKAEQMRHAAKLTELWNESVQAATNKWTNKFDVEAELKPRAKRALKPRAVSRRAVRFTASPASPTAAPVPVEQASKSGNDAAEDDVPPPLRDAIIYDLHEYVTEQMVERQLRNSGIVDQNGLGGKPEGEGFQEVTVPCVRTQHPLDPRLVGEEDEKSKDAPASASLRNFLRSTTAVSSSSSSKSATTKKLVVCQEPREHLFYTAMSLSMRAIDGIGKETAQLLMRNMTLRGYWESLKNPTEHSLPTGFKDR